MSQITNVFSSDDDDEILESLYMVVNVSPVVPHPVIVNPTKHIEHGGTWLDPRVD